MDQDLSEFEAEFEPRCGDEHSRNGVLLTCTAAPNHYGSHTVSDSVGVYAIWPNNRK